MRFNWGKWVPLVLFPLFCLTLIYVGLRKPDFFDRYSDLISTLTTLAFVYLTYETLRQTRQNEALPHIDVQFVLASKLSDNFVKKYPELTVNQAVSKLIEDFRKEDPQKKDMVFALVENIGDQTAIETRLDFDFIKRTFGTDSSRLISVPFGTLKGSERRMEFLDYFEPPSKDDYCEVKNVTASFSTVSRKHFADGRKRTDVSQTFTYKNFDDAVTVGFRR